MGEDIARKEEQCNEKAETEPRGGVQGEGGLGGVEGRQETGGAGQKYDVHGNQITQWKTQLLEGAIGVFMSPAEKRGTEHGPTPRLLARQRVPGTALAVD